jgi:hypothetical protein
MTTSAETVGNGAAAPDLFVASLDSQLRHRRAARIILLVMSYRRGDAGQEQDEGDEPGQSRPKPSKRYFRHLPEAETETSEQNSAGEQRREQNKIMHVAYRAVICSED